MIKKILKLSFIITNWSQSSQELEMSQKNMTPQEWALWHYQHDEKYRNKKNKYIRKYREQNPELVENKIKECIKNRRIYELIQDNNYDISCLTREQEKICIENFKYFIKKAIKENNLLMQQFFQEHIINDIEIKIPITNYTKRNISIPKPEIPDSQTNTKNNIHENIILIHPENR